MHLRTILIGQDHSFC